MIERGDNFKLVTGPDALASLAAWAATNEAIERKPRPKRDPLPAHLLPPMCGKPWTVADDDRLEQMWKFHSDIELGVLFGRSARAICTRRQMLGFVGCDWGRA